MSTSDYVTMQQRRGLRADLPATAPDGQLLIAKNTKELFFGTGTGVEQFVSPIPSISASRTLYVGLNGSDTTNDGSMNKPYATISKALSMITDATPTNRYVIRVAPGQYSESTTVNLKANVYIAGDHYQAVRYNASFAIDSSFSSNSDHRTGMSQMMIQGFTANFSSVTSNQGKVYFEDVTFISAVTITAHSNINQLIMDGCQVFGAFTLDGMNSRIVNTQFESTFAMNQPTSASTAATAVVNACYFISSISVTGATKSTNLFLYNSQVTGNATINGASASITASAESLPNKANIIIQNGGNFNRSDDAFSIAFTPANASLWGSSVPNNVLDALDVLATQASTSTTYTYTQPTPSATWIINHNLNKHPSVTIVDGDGHVVQSQVVYNSNLQVTVYLEPALAGAAYLN